MNWSEQQLKKTGLKNNYQQGDSSINISKPSTEKAFIDMVLLNLKQTGKINNFDHEYRFHNKRRFRFDWAIPDLYIAIEYEGLFSDKSGHTTISGFSKDCDKYNLAQIQGWTVLRYTAVNYKQVYDDLIKFIASN